MLKMNLKNHNLKQRLPHKEITLILHKMLQIFLKKKKLAPAFQTYLTYWNSKFLFQSSFTKVRTTCFLTGRTHSVYRHFYLSRIKLREFAGAGYFNGLSKASW